MRSSLPQMMLGKECWVRTEGFLDKAPDDASAPKPLKASKSFQPSYLLCDVGHPNFDSNLRNRLSPILGRVCRDTSCLSG